MAENFLPNRSEKARTFTAVMWVVGLAFLLQVLLVGWAFLIRSPRPQPPLTRGEGMAPAGGNREWVTAPPSHDLRPVAPVAAEDPATGVPAPETVAGNPDGESEFVTGDPENGIPATLENPPAGLEGQESSASVNMADLNRALEEAGLVSPPVSEPILASLVTTGEELRKSGNLQGALQALAKAEAALPEHPRILSQLAATYHEMGVTQASSEYWSEVVALGSAVGGRYYEIANRIRSRKPLVGPEPVAEAVEGKPDASENPSAVLAIGEIKVDEQPAGDAGQRVSLRIVVDSIKGETHLGEDLALFVFFYDLVNGDQILESTADTSYFYPTEPYDWKTNGKEEFIVNYSQPKFSPEEEIEMGVRRYYGYAIQLYYRDVLQDTVVQPAEISRLRLESAAPVAPPGGFPGGATPERIGPENALFPETPDL